MRDSDRESENEELKKKTERTNRGKLVLVERERMREGLNLDFFFRESEREVAARV